MLMQPPVRKLALTLHISSSAGAIGAVVAFLALALSGLSDRGDTAPAKVHVAMEAVALFAVLPLLAAALVSGVVQALGTPWGLFRHYWVATKLMLTIMVLAVLAMQLPGIVRLAGVERGTAAAAADITTLQTSFVVHAVGGACALLGLTALSVFKPGGLTRYGMRCRAIGSVAGTRVKR